VVKVKGKIKNLKFKEEGKKLFNWAKASMPVLSNTEPEFVKERPFEGKTIGCCLHVTKETAVLVLLLKAGGANVFLCGSNPLSTNDSIAAYLVSEGINVYAWEGMTSTEYDDAIEWVSDKHLNFVLDDGGDLTVKLNKRKSQEQIQDILLGTEETTTGLIRERALLNEGSLKFPIVAVNDAMTKHFFDNRYGTGQSCMDGIMRATSLLFAGKTIVVAGYGWCGRGIALRARGLGAKVAVTEVDEVKALEAVMDGFVALPMEKAIKQADLVITATGNVNVVGKNEIKKAKNGCILANAGHFDVEIDVKYLNNFPSTEVRKGVTEFNLGNKKIYLLAEGRLVNLSCAEGHPPEVMDMSFANQAYVLRWATELKEKIKPGIYPVPEKIDRKVAVKKLSSIGVEIDKLTKKQKKYLSSWEP
jgi:adenosylhomocysteinase